MENLLNLPVSTIVDKIVPKNAFGDEILLYVIFLLIGLIVSFGFIS